MRIVHSNTYKICMTIHSQVFYWQKLVFNNSFQLLVCNVWLVVVIYKYLVTRHLVAQNYF